MKSNFLEKVDECNKKFSEKEPVSPIVETVQNTETPVILTEEDAIDALEPVAKAIGIAHRTAMHGSKVGLSADESDFLANTKLKARIPSKIIDDLNVALKSMNGDFKPH